MDKIQFYYIDPNYIACLKVVDRRVPDVVYPGRHRKMLCGTVLQVNECSYYVPLSSRTVRSSTDFVIYGKKSKPIASLRFQYMIPVPESVLTKIDVVVLMQTDAKYGDLVQEEYYFCNEPENVREIKRMAKRAFTISSNRNHDKNRFFCDFAALEAAMREYQIDS